VYEAGGNSKLIAQAIVVVSISVELLCRLPPMLPLQGVVREFSGLVSPHGGSTPNKFLVQFLFVGAFSMLAVTGMFGLAVVQRTGAGTFYQARCE
jgi:hypothetical protein